VILPVQGPGGYELVINFKTARAFRPWHQQECPPNKIVKHCKIAKPCARKIKRKH